MKNDITCHREARNDFLRDSQNIPYTVPVEHSTTRRLLHSSITSNIASVPAAKTTIFSDQEKVHNFEKVVDFLILIQHHSP